MPTFYRRRPPAAAVFWLLMLAAMMPVSGRSQTPAVYLTMEEAIHRALAENTQIQSSRYAYQEALWSRRQAWTQLFPEVSFSTRYTWIDDSTLALRDFTRYLPFDVPQTVFQETYATSFDVTMPIFNGVLLNGLRIAAKNKEMAGHLNTSARQQTVYDVITAYLNLMHARSINNVQVQYLQLSQMNLNKARRMHEAGRYSQMEVLRWQVDYQQQKSALTNSETGMRQAAAELARVLNMDMHRQIVTEDSIPAALTTESDQIHQAPDNKIRKMIDLSHDQLVQANAALAAADARQEMSKMQHRNSYASFMPNVSLSYNYAWRENNTIELDDYSPKTFMIHFNVPVFKSFRNVTEAKATYYAYKKQKADFAGQLQNTRLTLTQTVNQIINLKDQLQLAATNVQYNEHNYRIVARQKEKGLASNIEFIDAKLNLQDAKLTQLKNRYDFISGIVRLYYLTGRLDKLIDY
ncbi:MAG: hypothetical protein GF313_09835 [Caldithrix sp.]|nr:hypothetical protein [Caldithrix sp.]